jgi:hyperosmotically inducible periplasmic protein
MTFRSQALVGVVAVLLSCAALAQTPAAPDSDSATAAASQPPTKAQIRAQMRADKPANKAFARKVQKAIYATKDLGDTDITVFAVARTGQVILAGMIMDESQDQIAQDAASKVPGVQSVVSKLTVYVPR